MFYSAFWTFFFSPFDNNLCFQFLFCIVYFINDKLTPTAAVISVFVANISFFLLYIFVEFTFVCFVYWIESVAMCVLNLIFWIVCRFQMSWYFDVMTCHIFKNFKFSNHINARTPFATNALSFNRSFGLYLHFCVVVFFYFFVQ